MPVSVLPVAFIESIGGGELMLVLVIALMLFGGDKLPELARGMGKAMREFKKTTGAMQDELKRAMEEVEAPPPTIMPPRPASPEIKSTPGIQPPGAEAPALPIDQAAPFDDGSGTFHDGSDPYGDPQAAPFDAVPASDTPAAPQPLASDPTTPPVKPDSPEQRPNPSPGPAA
jgi:TatA/E family protein of Tat protein translocase